MNNSLETTTTALNSAKNIIDQQALKLEKQHNKESIKTYNESGLGDRSNAYIGGSISKILYHAEKATTATHQFRLKGRSNFNSRAVKIEEVRERLGIKKAVIQPRNKEKVIEEKIIKKPSYIVDYENRFKSKLKGYLKNGYLEQKNSRTNL
ncbi:hypothetical protein [Pseudescherichia vulneris]|uniref:hypothetical protein n=1 Tax=Pseudescherichia vulneris TaxID=566 RepID=UPI0028D77A19|nr:hypothetical protein [Pseudescherichia vulneris]